MKISQITLSFTCIFARLDLNCNWPTVLKEDNRLQEALLVTALYNELKHAAVLLCVEQKGQFNSFHLGETHFFNQIYLKLIYKNLLFNERVNNGFFNLVVLFYGFKLIESKVVLKDSSTGMYQQLKELKEDREIIFTWRESELLNLKQNPEGGCWCTFLSHSS